MSGSANRIQQNTPGEVTPANCDSPPGTPSKERRHNRRGKGKRRDRRPERLVGLRLDNSCMIYRLKTRLSDLRTADRVLIDSEQGEKIGEISFVSVIRQGFKPTLFKGHLRRIIKRLGKKDLDAIEKRTVRELDAKQFCRDTIKRLGLKMKLSRVTFLPNGKKAVFIYTAESRVDFRELVRILAAHLKVRVEMRQIGVRDETRLLGGLGACGETFCCVRFVRKFQPVSVRMAKNQDLSLNPDAISGVCGRLMCCLAYENDTYTEMRRSLPRVNSLVRTQEGKEGVIRQVHPLQKTIAVYVQGSGFQKLEGEQVDALTVLPNSGGGGNRKSSSGKKRRGGGGRRPRRDRSGEQSSQNTRHNAESPKSTDKNEQSDTSQSQDQDKPQRSTTDEQVKAKRGNSKKRSSRRWRSRKNRETPSSQGETNTSQNKHASEPSSAQNTETNSSSDSSSKIENQKRSTKRRRRRRKRKGGGGEAKRSGNSQQKEHN
ncbi:MAG: hypothetical protein HQL50_03190 [Magnetococcales bacterium]|nr:hypothetical protein [Magnetococcales bacterium]